MWAQGYSTHLSSRNDPGFFFWYLQTLVLVKVYFTDMIPKLKFTKESMETAVKSPTKIRKIITVLVLSLALAIIIIDTTLLNVSLSAIIKDLNTDIQSIQWVITAYSLTLAALTITGGRIGDLFGRRKMFVFGAGIFAAGSFLASISQNVPTMIVGEAIIEGIGAALMMPATASLLVSNFKGRGRAIAFGVWGGVAGASAAIGPLLGGYLTTNYSWRWGFRINVVIAIILALGSLLIPDSRDKEERAAIDWVGVLLSAFGMLAFVFGVIESSRYGWWSATEAFYAFGYTLNFMGGLSIVPFALGLGLYFLTAFVFWELYMEKIKQTPLVSMRLFKNRQFTSGVLTTAILTLGQTGIIFSLPVFLQAVKGATAFETGIALLPMALTLLVVAPLGAFLSNKTKPKLLIQIGLLANMAGMIVLRQSLAVDTTTLGLAPGLMLVGAGMGLVMAQISNLTLSAVSVQQAGEAAGVNNTFRQVGATFGSAILGAVLLGALSTNLVSGINNSSVIPTNLKAKISQTISSQTSNVEFSGGAKFDSQLPLPISKEIVSISHQATVDANRETLQYGALFALIGFLVSFSLPKVAHEKGESLAAGH